MDDNIQSDLDDNFLIPKDSSRERITKHIDYTEADLGSVDLAADPNPDPEDINQGPGQGEDQMIDDAGDQGVIGGPNRVPVGDE